MNTATDKSHALLASVARWRPLATWSPELAKWCCPGNDHWCHAARDGTPDWVVVARYGMGPGGERERRFPTMEAALQFYFSYLSARRGC